MAEVGNRLFVQEVDQDELTTLLLAHFGSASQDPNGKSVTYGRQGQRPAIAVTYQDNSIVSVDALEGATEQDIEELAKKIREEVIAPENTVIAKRSFFCLYPVHGWFRFGARFQILPPPSFQRPSFGLMKHEPFLIEFSVRDTSNFQLRLQREQKVSQELELVLSALLEGNIRGLSRYMQSSWVMVPHQPNVPATCEYLQHGFWFDGIQQVSTDFSSVNGLEKMVEVDDDKYYTRYGWEIGRGLQVPRNIEILLSGYFALAAEQKRRFLRAAFWFQYSQKVFDESKSAALMALVQSIEALIPPGANEGRCNACGKEKGPSATMKFVSFLREHFGIAHDKKEIIKGWRDLFYMRSKLAHGGAVLLDDEDISVLSIVPDSAREQDQLRYAHRLTRLVLRNWLLATALGV